MGVEVFHALKRWLHGRGLASGRGRRGGFAPDLGSNEEALEALVAGIEAAERGPAATSAIALDPATSEIHRDGAYHLEHEGRVMSSDELAEYWWSLCDRYPIVSIEDGMDEEDWTGWRVYRPDRRPHAARRRRPVRHESRAPTARDRRRRRQLDPREGEPDRHAVGDAQGDPTSRARPVTRARPSCPTAPVRRRTSTDRRPRRGHRVRPDQDRCALALRQGRAGQPAARGSKSSSAPTPSTPVGAPFPRPPLGIPWRKTCGAAANRAPMATTARRPRLLAKGLRQQLLRRHAPVVEPARDPGGTAQPARPPGGAVCCSCLLVLSRPRHGLLGVMAPEP